MIKFSRVWAMPNLNTFEVPPIGDLVRRYLSDSQVSIDPFARNKQWATHTNDLNPDTTAMHHLDAEHFLKMCAGWSIKADLIIFDPPYSPRQISECYKAIGREVGMKETQSALLYQRVRDAITPVATDDAIVLSFGWNTVGMGKRHGFEQIEIMLCCHGGAHNDTICLAERRVKKHQPHDLFTPDPPVASAGVSAGGYPVGVAGLSGSTGAGEVSHRSGPVAT